MHMYIFYSLKARARTYLIQIYIRTHAHANTNNRTETFIRNCISNEQADKGCLQHTVREHISAHTHLIKLTYYYSSAFIFQFAYSVLLLFYVRQCISCPQCVHISLFLITFSSFPHIQFLYLSSGEVYTIRSRIFIMYCEYRA